MTDLRTLLQSQPALVTGLRPFVENAQWDEAASWLNEQLAFTEVVSHFITARGVLAALGATQGAAFLDTLEQVAQTNSPVKWALRFLQSSEGLDIGSDVTRAQLDALVAANLVNAQDANKLKALAEKSVQLFTEYDLRVAWFNIDGSEAL